VRLTVRAELADETARGRLLAQFVAIYPGVIDYQQRCAPRVPRIFLLHPTA